MERYFNNVIDRSGNAVAGAVIRVTDANGALATIFSDNASTAQANPLIADARGFFAFYAANGVYTLDISGASIPHQSIAGVLLEDVAGSGGSASVGFIQAGAGAVAGSAQNKLREVLSVKDFGAVGDGVTNDAPAFQAALTYAATLASAVVDVSWSSAAYKINSGLTIDTNKVSLVGHGAMLDCSGMTSGDLFTITQSAADVNQRPALNKAHPIQGFVFNGPGKSVAVTCAYIADVASSHTVCGVTFRDCGFWNWQTIADLRDGAFFTTFDNCDLGSPAGGTTGTCVSIPAGSNSGERNIFINCRFGNADLYLSQANGNSSTFFVGCSFNYGSRMFTITAGAVFIDGGHIEGNSDSDYWFHVSNNSNAALIGRGFQLIVSGAKTAKEVFYSDVAVTFGGVHLSDFALGSVNTFSVPLIGGTGRMSAKRMSAYAVGAKPLIGQGCNLLAYGGFESASFTNECTLGGTNIPDRSTTQKVSGSFSLRFQGLTGQNNNATWRVPCEPGQLFSTRWQAMLENVTNGCNFFASLSYLDANGTVLGTASAVMNLAANTAWTLQAPRHDVAAPIGTRFAQMFVSIFGVTSGTPIGYVDDVALNVV